MRDDVQNLKDSIPRGLNNQKDLTDTRLREVNAELKSLKTLITQRMNPTATSTSVSNYLRPTVSGDVTPSSAAVTPAAAPAPTPAPAPAPVQNASAAAKEEPKPAQQDYLSEGARSSPFSSGMQQAKASIPAWQMMASKSAGPSTPAAVNGADAGSETQGSASP